MMGGWDLALDALNDGGRTYGLTERGARAEALLLDLQANP